MRNDLAWGLARGVQHVFTFPPPSRERNAASGCDLDLFKRPLCIKRGEILQEEKARSAYGERRFRGEVRNTDATSGGGFRVRES